MQSPRHFSVEEDLLPRGRPPLVWTQATRQWPCRRGTRELGQGEGRTTKVVLVVVVGNFWGWVGKFWCTETYYNFWIRNYKMSNGFLGLFAVFVLMLGRLNARWTDALIVLCESEGDTHAFKKEGSIGTILNHRWYTEYATVLLIFFHVGWDTCYVRLLYSSSIEFWWQHFPTNMQGFAHLADHREWEAELTKGFHRDRSRYKKNKPWQKKRKWHMCQMLRWQEILWKKIHYVGRDAGPGSFQTWNAKGQVSFNCWWHLQPIPYLELQQVHNYDSGPLGIYSFPFRSFRSVRKAAPGWARKKVERSIACHMSDCKEKSADSSPLLPWEFKVNFIAISWWVQLVLIIRFARNILNHHPFHWHSKTYTSWFRFGLPRMLPRQTCSAWIISRCKWGTVMWPMVASLLNCRLISLCCCKLRTHVG